MATLNLTGQSVLAGQVQTRITQLRNAMDLRKPIWDGLTVEQKKAWVLNANDPLMTLSWNIYRYLRDNFFDVRVDE